jgi:hypothetical protein
MRSLLFVAGLWDFGLLRFENDVLACGGYSDQSGGWNLDCWRYDVPTNAWVKVTSFKRSHHRNTPILPYGNKVSNL